MAYDKFLIAPINIGLQTDTEPWLLPDDAYARLDNAYIWRGRMRKRFGSRHMGALGQRSSRLRILIDTTTAGGNASGATVEANSTYKVGQMFSIGAELFTVTTAGAVQPMLKTGATTTATYSTTDGAYNFVGADGLTAVYFYPAEPVMGLCNYEVGTINNQDSIAFDTRFAYKYSGTGWTRLGTAYWRGADNNFVWTCNWRGILSDDTILFATNFQVTNLSGIGTITDDPIWWWTGAAWTAGFDPATGLAVNGVSWFFAPTGALNTGPFVKTARIIIPFHSRLLLLNTVENDNGGGLGVNHHYGNRCRYSINGSPFAVNAWYETGKTDGANKSLHAGWIDAPVKENIISAEFIKDRLIVYFEQSTWEIVYTGNALKPFVWQRLNTELGSQAQFSSVPFDKVVLTVGNTGVHACNGLNVERVDQKIPDEIFKIKNKNEGVERVAGIRDYYTEMVYWTFPDAESPNDFIYPTRVLVYNYKNGSWAFNDDCLTVFGYFEQQTDTTWDIAVMTWAQYDALWTAGILQANFRQIIAGNQQGFVIIINAEINKNADALQISKVELATPAVGLVRLTIIDHTVSIGDCLSLANMNGLTIVRDPLFLGDPLYMVTAIDIANHTVTIATTKTVSITGIYLGGGLASRVSRPKILTKRFNPYIKSAQNVYIAKVDFYVKKTDAGELTVDYYPSTSELSMIAQGTLSGSQLGSNILETKPYDTVPFEIKQTKIWHSVYFQTVGENIQFVITLTDEQLTNSAIAFEGFIIDGMILYTMPIYRLQ